jgi:FAD/FMN-containing dehydrogenase
VAENAATIRRICKERGALKDYLAETDREIERFWRIRKRIPWYIIARYASHHSIEDIVVPIASISTALSGLQQISDKYRVPIPVNGTSTVVL